MVGLDRGKTTVLVVHGVGASRDLQDHKKLKLLQEKKRLWTSIPVLLENLLTLQLTTNHREKKEEEAP